MKIRTSEPDMSLPSAKKY